METWGSEVNYTSLSILAKLLATENITVEHVPNTDTASFHLADRRLVLPIFTNIDRQVYNMFVAHEVGHALYTPQHQWELVLSQPPAFVRSRLVYHDYLNVVEDVRIERKVKLQYPGLKRDFLYAYRDLFYHGFFGSTPVYKMGLADRLNIYYKVGAAAGVTFSPQEEQFLDALEDMETFTDAVHVANDLYQWSVQVESKRRRQAPTDNLQADSADTSMLPSGGGTDEAQEDKEDGKEARRGDESFDDENANGPAVVLPGHVPGTAAGENAKKDRKAEAEQPAQVIQGYTDDYDYATSSGSDAPHEACEVVGYQAFLTATKQKVLATSDVRAPIAVVWPKTVPYKDYILPYKGVLAIIEKESENSTSNHKGISFTSIQWEDEANSDTESGSTSFSTGYYPYYYGNRDKRSIVLTDTKFVWKAFKQKNLQTVNYLVQEFEARKAASAYARQRAAKTGVLDPEKLHQYRFEDQLFKRMCIVPEGKKHALLMYIDFSGSMASHMEGSVKQLLNLALFCRKANVPFRAYGFTDSSYPADCGIYYPPIDDMLRRRKSYTPTEGEMSLGSRPNDFWLLELFHEDMTLPEFNAMGGILLTQFMENSTQSTKLFGLHATPLNEAVMMARYQTEDLRQKTKAEAITAVFLTDGDATSAVSYTKLANDRYTGLGTQGKFARQHYQAYLTATSVFRDAMTHVDLPVVDNTRSVKTGWRANSSQNVTERLVELLRIAAGVHAVAFFVASGRAATAKLATFGHQVNHKTWRDDRYAAVPGGMGCDEFYIIAGGKELNTDQSTDFFTSATTKREVDNKFKNFNKSKTKQRVILSKFIEQMSTVKGLTRPR